VIAAVVQALAGFFDRPPIEILRDLLDLALVAYLVYRVLRLLKGTRAMQMAIGLALVFVAYQVAQRLGLLTLFTLLDTLLTYIVLLIVVIFQHDIRRALMRVGRQPLFRSARLAARESRVIDETAKAARTLAQRRIGALVVFERAAALDEFIEPGVELDAEVSQELLVSLFLPSFENPMHDGAVIVREGRVWQAGAFLPLSTASGLDRALGTRHRAALGISEDTDAVVVVVSEERGSMTVCFGGNLVRDLDAKSLERVLRGLLQPRGRRRRKGRKGKAWRAPVATAPRPVHQDGTASASGTAGPDTAAAASEGNAGSPRTDPTQEPRAESPDGARTQTAQRGGKADEDRPSRPGSGGGGAPGELGRQEATSS